MFSSFNPYRDYTDLYISTAYNLPPNSYIYGKMNGQDVKISGPMSEGEAQEVMDKYGTNKHLNGKCCDGNTCIYCYPPMCRYFRDNNIAATCNGGADCQICRNRKLS